MPIPIIDTTQSILGFLQYGEVGFTPAANGEPFRWEAQWLPPGLEIETHQVRTITPAAAGSLIGVVGHNYADGDALYLPTLSGGTGWVVNRIYYVRDYAAQSPAFRLAAYPGGPAVNFTTAITAGSISKVSSGRISGASEVPGTHAVTLRAYNADGASLNQVFTFGFDPTPGAPVDDALDIYIDAGTGRVSLMADASPRATGQEEEAIFSAKMRDKKLLRVHYHKGGNPVTIALTALSIVCVELKEEPVKLVVGDEFEQPSGKSYFNLVAEFTNNQLRAAVSNYPAEFRGWCQIEWRRTIPWGSGTRELVNTTESFAVEFANDFDRA